MIWLEICLIFIKIKSKNRLWYLIHISIFSFLLFGLNILDRFNEIQRMLNNRKMIYVCSGGVFMFVMH